MSKFKIPLWAHCDHCETKIRNVDLCKQNDGCFLCPQCDQEDILRKFHTVSQNFILLTSRLIEVSTDFSIFQGTVSHKISSEKSKTPKDNFIRSNWISLHVNRYWTAKSPTVRDQIAKMMHLAFEVSTKSYSQSSHSYKHLFDISFLFLGHCAL